jgi:gluconolactonase
MADNGRAGTRQDSNYWALVRPSIAFLLATLEQIPIGAFDNCNKMADIEAPRFAIYDAGFSEILGYSPEIHPCLEDEKYPWAHEACVFVPSTNHLFITSNRILQRDGEQHIAITKVNIGTDPIEREELMSRIPMGNGGVNYKNGVLFCGQGSKDSPSGLYFMEVDAPYRTTLLVSSFNGRPFNSPNDVVVHSDGSIWFTDPMYGYEQGFRPPPQLPNQVYRYEPSNKSIRAMADGFDRPNGISFSPDQQTLYVTDTGFIHGDGTTDMTRPASM